MLKEERFSFAGVLGGFRQSSLRYTLGLYLSALPSGVFTAPFSHVDPREEQTQQHVSPCYVTRKLFDPPAYNGAVQNREITVPIIL